MASSTVWMQRTRNRRMLADGQAAHQPGDTEDPVAYTRMSRTPIFKEPDLEPGVVGEFNSPTSDSPGFINLRPQVFTNPSLSDLRAIRHESTHAALDPYIDDIAYRMPPGRLKKFAGALAGTGGYTDNSDPADTATELAAYAQEPGHFLGEDDPDHSIERSLHGAKEELLPAMRASGVPDRLMRHYEQGFSPVGQTAGSVPVARPEAHGPGRAPGKPLITPGPGPGRGMYADGAVPRRYYGQR